jgi:hypothetical protein
MVAAYLLGTGGLARFLAAAGMPRDVGSVRREHIESYIADCLARNAPATANQRSGPFRPSGGGPPRRARSQRTRCGG